MPLHSRHHHRHSLTILNVTRFERITMSECSAAQGVQWYMRTRVLLMTTHLDDKPLLHCFLTAWDAPAWGNAVTTDFSSYVLAVPYVDYPTPAFELNEILATDIKHKSLCNLRDRQTFSLALRHYGINSNGNFEPRVVCDDDLVWCGEWHSKHPISVETVRFIPES